MVAIRHSKSWAIPKFDTKDNSLVLYLPLWYPYSDMTGGTVYSYDRNRYTGTLTGTVWGRDGRDLDGTDDIISIADNATLSAISPISVIVWAKPDVTGSIRVLLSKDAASLQREWYLLINASDNLIFYQVNSGGAGVGYLGRAATTNTIVAGNFYCFGVTWTGVDAVADILLYWNGVVEASYTDDRSGSGAVPWDSTAPVEIGRYNADNASCWNGIVGEVLVYSRVLTAGEMRRIYQVTKWRYV